MKMLEGETLRSQILILFLITWTTLILKSHLILIQNCYLLAHNDNNEYCERDHKFDFSEIDWVHTDHETSETLGNR